MNEIIKLSGSDYFRVKIAYSLLMNRPIIINNIRYNSINPGLTDYEVSFLKLVEAITNGSRVEISKTGSLVKFFPGVITNNYGQDFEFSCDNSRAVTYYLEGILPIAMFGKESLNCTLKGVTNNSDDMSADTFRNVTCQLVQKLVLGDTISLNIIKRGVYPLGNGIVKFKCPIVTLMNVFDWIDEGKIKRIRGLAFTSRISSAMTTRMIDACRGMFNNFLPDVWIDVDNVKSKNKEEM